MSGVDSMATFSPLTFKSFTGSVVHAVSVGLLTWECFINLPFDILLILAKGWSSPHRCLTRISYLCSRYLALFSSIAALLFRAGVFLQEGMCSVRAATIFSLIVIMEVMSSFLVFGRTLTLFPSDSLPDKLVRLSLLMGFVGAVTGSSAVPYAYCQYQRTNGEDRLGIQVNVVTGLVFPSAALAFSILKIASHLRSHSSGRASGRHQQRPDITSLAFSFKARVQQQDYEERGRKLQKANPLVLYLVLQGCYTLVFIELLAVLQCAICFAVSNSVTTKMDAVYFCAKLSCVLSGVAFRDTYKAACALREIRASHEMAVLTSRNRAVSSSRDSDQASDQALTLREGVEETMQGQALDGKKVDDDTLHNIEDGFRSSSSRMSVKELDELRTLPSRQSTTDILGGMKGVGSIQNEASSPVAEKQTHEGADMRASRVEPEVDLVTETMPGISRWQRRFSRAPQPAKDALRQPLKPRRDSLSLATELARQGKAELAKPQGPLRELGPALPKQGPSGWLRRMIPKTESQRRADDLHGIRSGLRQRPRIRTEGLAQQLSVEPDSRQDTPSDMSEAGMVLCFDAFDDGQERTRHVGGSGAGETLARVCILGYRPVGQRAEERLEPLSPPIAAPPDPWDPSTAGWQQHQLRSITSLPPPPRKALKKSRSSMVTKDG